MANVWKVSITSGTLNVRNGAGTSGTNVVGSLANGSQFEEISQQEVKYSTRNELWVQHSKGWSIIKSYYSYGTTIKEYCTIVGTSEGGVVTSSTNSSQDTSSGTDWTVSGGDESSGYQPSIEEMLNYETGNYSSDGSAFYKLSSVIGAFGLPYQFDPRADVRMDSSPYMANTDVSSIGAVYAENIVARMPLFFIAPGRANFMTKFNRQTKQNVLEKLLTANLVSSTANIDDLLDKDGRYYTFEYAVPEYYGYVNPMCRIAARYLEIQDFELDGVKLDAVNWANYVADKITGIGDLHGEFMHIPFYLNSDTSISESFSNSTTDSMIATAANSASDMGRELNFLLGNAKVNGSAIADIIGSNAEVAANIENLQNMVSSLLGSNNFISNLASQLVTVAAGGKLMFPQIWSDSSMNRSYDVEIRLNSPDCSKLSIFLNVLVPLFHLIAMVAPQSVAGNPNGYTNPFIVRAIYKGMFNIDMGIIESMGINRGGDCQWTPDGIPTSIVVTMTIKDLYDVFSITPSALSDFKYDTLNNTALMDYIANMCGINMYKPEIGRMIDMWLVNETNKISDLVSVGLWGNIQNSIQNAIMGIYR